MSGMISVWRTHRTWRVGCVVCVHVCVCARARGVGWWRWVNHPCGKKENLQTKAFKGPFICFPIEIWWIFCHRAFEVIAEHTVQRNAHLGHCLPALCCHLHCALLTWCFSLEQHPTPPINASLGPVLAVSRGGGHVSRLFSPNSHTQTFTTEEKLLRSPPPLKNLGTVHFPFSHTLHSVAGPECIFGSFLFVKAYPWSPHVIVQLFYSAFNHISLHERN